MFDRFFRLRENGTSVRTELTAGLVTFLTMAYIIFVQPAVLSGKMFNMDTGMDFGALTAATCYSAAIGTLIMGLWARYPVALAPGMGENFFFVFTAIPVAAAAGYAVPWQAALGAVFVSGLLFVAVSLVGARKLLMDLISPSMKHGIAVGIGFFIAFIGFQNAGLILKDPGTAVKLNPRFDSPDLIVFFVGLFVMAGLYARKVRGAILIGLAVATALAVGPETVAAVRPGLDCRRQGGQGLHPRPALPDRHISRFGTAVGFAHPVQDGHRRGVLAADASHRDHLPLYGCLRHHRDAHRRRAAGGTSQGQPTSPRGARFPCRLGGDGCGRGDGHEYGDGLHRERGGR